MRQRDGTRSRFSRYSLTALLMSGTAGIRLRLVATVLVMRAQAALAAALARRIPPATCGGRRYRSGRQKRENRCDESHLGILTLTRPGVNRIEFAHDDPRIHQAGTIAATVQKVVATMVLAIFTSLAAADSVCCPHGCTDTPQTLTLFNHSSQFSCALCIGGMQVSAVHSLSRDGVLPEHLPAAHVLSLTTSAPHPLEHPPTPVALRRLVSHCTL
jgi:hypothetical protein